MIRFKAIAIASSTALTLSAGAISNAQAAEPIIIGGGSTTGVYYQVALHVCNLVNKHMGKKYNCVGRPALGSVFNINAVKRGLLDFGVAQSDRNSQAWNGEANWKKKGKIKELRSVFSAHPETVLLVARADSGIKSFADLKGKRVNIGNPGSGQRGNAKDVIRIYKLKGLRAQGLQQGQASRSLIDKKIQAFFYTVGNPSAAIEEPANSTAIRLIAINSAAIKKFVSSRPYYVMTTIPANTYKGVGYPVETYAVKATVVTSSKVPAQKVYDVVKTVFEHLDELKKAHKAFRILNPKGMMKGLTAPLHAGAAKYYKERGWMK